MTLPYFLSSAKQNDKISLIKHSTREETVAAHSGIVSTPIASSLKQKKLWLELLEPVSFAEFCFHQWTSVLYPVLPKKGTGLAANSGRC